MQHPKEFCWRSPRDSVLRFLTCRTLHTFCCACFRRSKNCKGTPAMTLWPQHWRWVVFSTPQAQLILTSLCLQRVREDCDKFAVSALIQATFVFYCQDNIFEWHFAVRGPPDTEFQVGPCKDHFIAKLALCSSATWSNS